MATETVISLVVGVCSVFVIIGLVIAGYFYRLYRRKKAEANQLEKENDELEKKNDLLDFQKNNLEASSNDDDERCLVAAAGGGNDWWD